MNANQRNAVLATLHEALDGKLRVLYSPGMRAEEMVRVAERFKVEDSRYRHIAVHESGPSRVTFELQRGEAEGFGHLTDTGRDESA
jgi:hypothetical protein